MKILLVRLGSLGDIVHGLPVAAAIRQAFPEARLDWLVDVRHAALLELVPVLDRRVAVTASLVGFLRAVPTLRPERYDVCLDLQGLYKSAALARASGARRVVGFPREHLREPGAGRFYTETCDVAGTHVIEKNLSLLGALGLRVGLASASFPLSEGGPALTAKWREAVRALVEDAPFMVLNPGGGWPNKRWGPERFGQLAAAIRERHQLSSVVVWGPAERELAEAVVGSSAGAAVLSPDTTVPDLLALVRLARLVVAGDTGPLHLALAAGTPVVGLFGPTDPARNGPWRDGEGVVSAHGSCQCHYARRCHATAPCLSSDELSVERVAAAVGTRLAAGGA